MNLVLTPAAEELEGRKEEAHIKGVATIGLTSPKVLPEGFNLETDKKRESGSYCQLMRRDVLAGGGVSEVDDDNHDDQLDDVIGSSQELGERDRMGRLVPFHSCPH